MKINVTLERTVRDEISGKSNILKGFGLIFYVVLLRKYNDKICTI